MYQILFYKDKNGNQPVADYMTMLACKKDKDSRIKLKKINDYIEMLSQYGTQVGEPYLKHIEGDIWELRPLRDRIFFVGWVNGSYVLLHHFMKKLVKPHTQKLKKQNENLKT